MLDLAIFSVTINARCRWVLVLAIHYTFFFFFLLNMVVFIDVSVFILVIVGVLISKLFQSSLYISLPANGSIDEPGNASHRSKL